jgi:hypothetical protein
MTEPCPDFEQLYREELARANDLEADVPDGHLLIQKRIGQEGTGASYWLTAGAGLGPDFEMDSIQRAFGPLRPLVYQRAERGPQLERVIGRYSRPGNGEPTFSWEQSDRLPPHLWGTLEPRITSLILTAIAGGNGEYLSPAKLILRDVTSR